MINCFLCQKDITNSVKCFSYHTFDDRERNPMCSDCAEKDLEVAHQQVVQKKEINALKKQIAEHRCPELPRNWFKRLLYNPANTKQ